jgi:hypothetical protein
VTLAVIVAVGAAARLALMTQVMRYDESVTFLLFGKSFEAALTDYGFLGPNNHILHTLLVRASTLVFGTDPWAIRVPAFLFGVLLIVVTYWWIASAVNQRAGLIAAALVAGSSLLIEYSTFARGYMIQAVAFVILMEMGRRLLAEASLRRWAVWVVVALAGFATSPPFAFSFAAVVAWMGLNVVVDRQAGPRASMIWSLSLAVAAVAALSFLFHVPAIIASGWAAVFDNDFVQPVPLWRLRSELWEMVVRTTRFILRDGVLAWALPVLVTAAIVENRRTFRRFLTPALSAIGPIGVLALLRVAPPPRIWLFLWPLYLALAAVGFIALLDRLPPRLQRTWLVPTTAAALVVTMGLSVLATGEVLQSREGGTFRDGPEAAEFFDRELQPRDRIIVVSHPWAVLEYYLEKGGRDGSQIRSSIDEATRLFVVVYHPRPQDLEGVLSGVDTGDFTAPRLVEQLPETDLYLMERWRQ